MPVCSIDCIIKVSLTIIISISFIYMGINNYFNKKKYLTLWFIGLGFFSINYILARVTAYRYDFKILYFLQMAAYMYGGIFIAEGSICFLDREYKSKLRILMVIGTAILALWGIDGFNSKIILLPYFGMLCYVNSLAAISYYKAQKSPGYSRKFVAVLYFAMAAVDISDYVFFIYHNEFLLNLFVKAILLIIWYQYLTIIYMKDKVNLSYDKYETLLNCCDSSIAVLDKDYRYAAANQYYVNKVKNQRAIAENELKYRSLVEQSLDGIVLVDKNGYIIEFNREMERISGISKEDAINMHVVDIQIELSKGKAYYGKDINEIKKNFERNHIDSNNLGKSKTYCAELSNRDGKAIDVEEFYYPIITESAKMVCFTFRDITELKKLERIKEKVEANEKLTKETIELDRLRTEFFANLSHEFRTPLNIILSSNKMISNIMSSYHEGGHFGVKHQKVNKYLLSSQQNCYRLLRLINNIIDISKMDSGFFHSNLQCWNIVSVVEEITQSIADYAKNKGICIIFDTDIEEKNTLCDADAIERIILNLISNSIKFTEAGGSINVTLKDMNSHIEIMVEDSGIGIPEEQLPLIFNRFKQVDKSLARRQEGSGIGLSLVKSLVEMHEGTIEVFSKVGEGTKFIIKLPTKDSCSIDEVAAGRELYDSRVEKVNIEFSDIYF